MEPTRRSICAGVLLIVALVTPLPAVAQYAEVPRPLPAPVSTSFGHTSAGWFMAATQIGRRLFVAGHFTRLTAPIGGAVVTTVLGTAVPGAFPFFGGSVGQIVRDDAGGWLVAGDFSSVNGQPSTGFARVNPDRTVDMRFRVVVDGAITRLAIAHGRVYIGGAFTTINGASRRGLAALDARTGQLTPWGAGFDARSRVRELAASSIAVYVSGGDAPGHVWGLDAGTGRVLFDRPGFVSALAATSDRVYLGGVGFARPVWAVDPLTGTDVDWATDLTFQYVRVTYDLDGTQVTALLLDGDRLYIGGRFRTAEGHTSLAAVQAVDGAALGWRPAAPGPFGSATVALFRVGPAIAASFGVSLGVSGSLYAFHVDTAAALPFQPELVGGVAALAPAPEGVVLGGSFSASGGVDRAGLASIDLDTFAVEPWTAGATFWPGLAISELATDGTWLFAVTEGNLGGTNARVLKIDPATGAIVGERTFPSVWTRMRVAGAELLVSTLTPNTNAGELGAITIADWSFAALPVTFVGWVTSLDVGGDVVYLGGRFSAVNGQSRRSFAAVHRVTGALQAWQPAPNADGGSVRTAAGRVWIAGEFTRVGGQPHRGLAEVDPSTGAPLPWNPDVAGVLSGGSVFFGVQRVEIADDGHLYASLGPSFSSEMPRAVAAGQLTPLALVYSAANGGRLPWRPADANVIAITPDCVVVQGGCLPPAVPSPTNLDVSVADHIVTITWTLPVTPAMNGVRLEVGTVEGSADLLALDLPPNQASFTAAAPPGRYVARVRALAGPATSLTTPDVSFAVGPPNVPGAPLDLTARRDGARVTFAWQPPSTGVPSHYELEAGTAPGQRDIGALSVAGGATSLTLTLTAGTYWTRLVAVNQAGRSAPSAEAMVDLVARQSCSTSPPLNLAASVSNRVVTLTWDPPADGSEAPPQIVAGSVPGGSDIGTLTAPPFTTTFSIAAPPGTYYVRLEVGCFTIGKSNEVQVVVP